jgi:ribosomal protein L22
VCAMKHRKDAEDPSKAAKARGGYLRCHFKHLREVAHNIRYNQLVALQTARAASEQIN